MRQIVVILAATALFGCAPHISSLNPDNGSPRTVAEVHGDTILSSVCWDADGAGERNVPGGFLGGYIFSVPVGSGAGIYQVQLKRSGKEGNKVPFTVTAPVPFGSPRLDRVSIAYAAFDTGSVNTWLYVQGANADVGAEVLVNGSVVPTYAHKVLRNDLYCINPADFKYPIYHHLAMIAAPGPQPLGSTLNVQIRNLDGSLSNVRSYTMPASEAALDSDGDDLPDAWEKNGYDADGDGVIDVDLPALGADPLRPDIFVEVDIMNSLANSPGAGVWNVVEAAFANAPIINPGDINGVHLVVDTSGSVPFWNSVSLTAADNAAGGLANFYTLKTNNFDNTRRGRIYHYCIWGNMQPGGYSGISDVHSNNLDFDGPGDDFLISFDDFPASFQTVRSMAATFMHELGHDLQQRHGGQTHASYNPVYNSVMSYSWQIRTGKSDAARVSLPVYSPLYYQLCGAVEVNGAVPAGVTSVLPDYSSGMGRDLQENNLSEPVGLYGNNAVDWNGDGDTVDLGVSKDLNDDGDTSDTATDYSNWANLVYSGPRQNGQYGN